MYLCLYCIIVILKKKLKVKLLYPLLHTWIGFTYYFKLPIDWSNWSIRSSVCVEKITPVKHNVASNLNTMNPCWMWARCLVRIRLRMFALVIEPFIEQHIDLIWKTQKLTRNYSHTRSNFLWNCYNIPYPALLVAIYHDTFAECL